MEYLADSDLENAQCEAGPTESHEVEIWQVPTMSLEPEQEVQEEVKENISLSVAPNELQVSAVVPASQQQTGTSTAATQGKRAADQNLRIHPRPGHRVKVPKFLERVKGRMWFGNSLPASCDLEDQTVRNNLRIRFYGELRKLKIKWSKNALLVSEAKGATIDGDIQSMTFTVGLRVDRRQSFVDYELGTTTVTTRRGDGSQFIFNIVNRIESKKIDLSVATMVRACEVVFQMKLVKSSEAMDLLIDSSDSE